MKKNCFQRTLPLLTVLFTLQSCFPPTTQVAPQQVKTPTQPNLLSGFNTKSLHASEPPAPQLEQVSATPENPTYELSFLTGQAGADAVRMPEQGEFKVSIETGQNFAILDNDATDGMARIQVPASVFDIYLKPEHSGQPALCQTTGTTGAILDQMDQEVQSKINTLVAAGKAHCTYLPPQRQNSNCNSTGSGLNCSGSLNKTIQTAQCPEIAVYAGAVNLNNDLSASKFFMAASNNLTLNQSAKGVFSSRGNLNVNLNNNGMLEGIFVSGSSSNLNLSGSPQLKGLYKMANNSSLAMNLNNNARFEGALCSAGQVNANRNGNSQTIYHPDVLLPWLADVPSLPDLMCEARANFYTQNIPKTCSGGSSSSSASLDVKDPLYLINQTLTTNNHWYKMPGRALPVPADWYSPDGQKYVLTLENHGATKLTSRWFTQSNAPQVPQSVRVIPRVDCIRPNRNGTFTAYLGYENQMSGPVTLPVGDLNKLSPDPADKGQPTTFQPGPSASFPQSVHSVIFIETLAWELNQRQIVINSADESLYCPENQASIVPIPANTAVRKTLLPQQTITLSQPTQTVPLPFVLPEAADLKRRIMVNLINGPGNSTKVEGLKLSLNHQPVVPTRPDIDFLNAQVPDMVAELIGSHLGENQLSLQISGPVGAQVSLSVEGFMRTAYIPGAFHSAIDHNELIRTAPTFKGIVGIKFMEGMKVRLNEAAHQYERFSDLTGLSLAPLRAFIAYHEVSEIVPALPGTPEEKDALEQQAETNTVHEAPNQNLYYYLVFDEGKDVWGMVDQLSTMPFIEEAYPMFEFVSPQASPTPTPSPTLAPFVPAEVSPGSVFIGLEGGYPRTKWLTSTRILNSNVVPSPLPLPGAWDITRGTPDVKIAVIEHGINTSHEDLGNIQQIANISPASGYNDLGHATATVGIVGATHSNSGTNVGQGSIGVAHGASVWHIFGLYNHPNKSWSNFLCKGTGGFCNQRVDAMALAKKEGMNVIVVEVEGRDPLPGSLEQFDPPSRSYIAQSLVPQGISVVLPAGNRACSQYKLPEEQSGKNACMSVYSPNGKNIKQFTAAETIFKWQELCLIPNPALLSAPYGIIIYSALQAGFLGCINNLGNTADHIKEYKVTHTDMPDSGSIIVGGLKIDGSGRIATGPNELPYNYGKSVTSDFFDTMGGHGTDISGPAELIWTTSYDSSSPANNSYATFPGTSGAAPVVGGVVALMLSVNPTLKTPEKAKYVRKILRETQQPLPSGEDISGMVNAYEAVKAATNMEGGLYTIAALKSPPAGATPSGYGVKSFVEPQYTEPMLMRAGDKFGIFFDHTLYTNLTIEIQGQQAVYTTPNNDFVSVTVPANLAVGNTSVLFKTDQGQFELQNLINYTSPFPEVVTFSKPTIFSNGLDVVDGYATVKDQNGNPVPDGTQLYVRLSGNHTAGAYANGLLLINPATAEAFGDGSVPERVLTVQNGKLHFQVKLNWAASPYEYNYDWATGTENALTWPHPEAPAVHVEICNPAYSSSKPGYGYYCGERLFPQAGNNLDGRLYSVNAYSFNPQINFVQAGAPAQTYTLTNLRDVEGNLVPVGTRLYFNQTYYGVVSAPDGSDIYWGSVTHAPGEVNIVYTPFERLPCELVGVVEPVYVSHNRSTDPRHVLIGSPVRFQYTPC